MAKKPEFPVQLFVKTDKDGDATYYIAQNCIDGLVDVGDCIKIGVYDLVQTVEIEGVVKVHGDIK